MSNSDTLFQRMRGFRGNVSGNVAMIFSLSIIPMMAMGGAAMDLSRAVREKTELQSAADAAVMAAGRMMGKPAGEMLAVATGHLTAGHGSPDYTFKAAPAYTDASKMDEVCLTAKTSLPTTVMKVMGVNFIDLSAKSCAKKGGQNYEIAMVLDNSGSMKRDKDGNSLSTPNGGGYNSQSKIEGLKSAATSLITQLFPVGGGNSFFRLSIVPFGSNVKAFNPDTIAEAGNSNEATRYDGLSWMDLNGESPVHWENWTKAGAGITFQPKNRFELHANIGTKWTGCMESRPGAQALTDAPVTTGQANTLYVPFFANDGKDSGGTNNYMSDVGTSLCTSSNNDPYKL
jgi:hypothetical protein